MSLETKTPGHLWKTRVVDDHTSIKMKKPLYD